MDATSHSCIDYCHSIHAVIGGMHLLRATNERLVFTGDKLNDLNVQYLAANHCASLYVAR